MIGGETKADIGLVDASVQSDAIHVFELSNNSSAPLNVSGLRGTCGCEKLALLSDGKQVNKLTVPTGGSFQVQVGVRLEGQPLGSVTKMAYILGGPTGSSILHDLCLTFRVRQPIAFDPPRLNLVMSRPDLVQLESLQSLSINRSQTAFQIPFFRQIAHF